MNEDRITLPRLIDDNDMEKLTLFYNKAYGKNHILNNSTHHDWQFGKNPFNRFKRKS